MDTPPEANIVADASLDAGEGGCADLLLLIVKAMRDLQAGQVLHVVAYDPGAVEDIPAWCRMTAHTLLKHIPAQGASQAAHFYIQKRRDDPTRRSHRAQTKPCAS